MKKRLLAGLLALAMLFTMLPTAAFAADGTLGNAIYDIQYGTFYHASGERMPGWKISVQNRSNNVTTSEFTLWVPNPARIEQTLRGYARYTAGENGTGVYTESVAASYYESMFDYGPVLSVLLSESELENCGIKANTGYKFDHYEITYLNRNSSSDSFTQQTQIFYPGDVMPFDGNMDRNYEIQQGYLEIKCVYVEDPDYEVTYTLSYDANGGTGAPESETRKSTNEQEIFTVSSIEPTREGYKFLGWADKADGTGSTYKAGETITLNKTASSKTIYAVWEKEPEPVTYYTVTYTDGVENETVFKDQVTKVESGKETPAFEGTPARKDYVFAGWSPEIAETVTGDVTYTAQWNEVKPEPSSINVKFHLTDGATWTDRDDTNDSVYPLWSNTPTSENTAPDVKVPAGKKFVHWTTTGTKTLTAGEGFSYNDMINFAENGEVILTPVFEEDGTVDPEPQSINVKFRLEDGATWTDRDDTNDSVYPLWSNTPTSENTAPDVKAPAGKKFVHWTTTGTKTLTAGEGFSYNDMINFAKNGEVILTPVFEDDGTVDPEPQSINVKFRLEDGATWTDREDTNDSTYTLWSDTPTSENTAPDVKAPAGKKFVHWTTTGTKTLTAGEGFSYNDMINFAENGEVILIPVFEDDGTVETEQTIYVHFDIFEGEWMDSVPTENSKQFVLRSSTADAELDIPGVVAPAGKNFVQWKDNLEAGLDLTDKETFSYNDLADYVTFDADGNAYIGFTAVFEDKAPVEDEQTITVNFTIFEGEWTDSVPAENSKQFVLRSSTADAELEIPAVVAPAGKTFDKWENNIGADLTLGAVGTFTYNNLAEYVTFDADGNAYIGFTAVFKDAAPVVPGDEDKPTETDSSIGALVGTGVVLAGGAAALTYYYREALPIWKYAAIVKLADDTPVQNATVTLIQDGETVKTVTTDDNGYIQTRVAKGTYQVVVTWERDGVQYTAHTEATVERMAGDIQPQEIVLALE